MQWTSEVGISVIYCFNEHDVIGIFAKTMCYESLDTISKIHMVRIQVQQKQLFL